MASADEIRAQSYVGFDSITQQIEHKLLKRGFQFNVIVVGQYFHCSFPLSTNMILLCLRKKSFSQLPVCTRFLTGVYFTGPTGLGKSTLINTIFASHLIETKGRFVADEPVRQTTEIQAVSHGKFAFILQLLLCDFSLRATPHFVRKTFSFRKSLLVY
jgi:predicted ATPase